MERIGALPEGSDRRRRLACTPPQWDKLGRWTAALALLLAAIALRLELEILPRTELFALFYPAVLLSAWLAGPVPATFVSAGSAVAVWWFLVRTPGVIAAPSSAAAVAILLFLVSSGICITIITCSARATASPQSRSDA